MARKSEPAEIPDAIYAAAIEPAKWSNVLDPLPRLCKASVSVLVQHINGAGLRGGNRI